MPLFEVPVVPPADLVDAAVVTAAGLVLDGAESVLPRTELSGLRGYLVVVERMSAGAGPMLDAQVLELWEMCPAEGAGAPPAAPLSIVGFVAIGQWKRARYVASELRGFGETVVLTERRPTALSLTAADLADVSVVQTSHAGEELLVRGSKVVDPPRIAVTSILMMSVLALTMWEARRAPRPIRWPMCSVSSAVNCCVA